MRGLTLSIILVAAVIVTAAALSGGASSHQDPPSPPTIVVRVYLESFKFLEPQNDGLFDNNAEPVFSWVLTHIGHASETDSPIPAPRTGSESNADLADGTTWMINKQIYFHLECTPLNPIVMGFVVKESDQDIGASIAVLSVALAGMVVTTLTTAVVAAPAIAIAALATVLIIQLNGDEDKGAGASEGGGGGPGTFTTKTSGADGGAEIKWRVEVEERSAAGCATPSPTPSPTPTPILPPIETPGGEKCRDYSNAIDDALAAAEESHVEPDIDTTPEEFEQLQEQAPAEVINSVDAWFDWMIANALGKIADPGRLLQLQALAQAQWQAGLLDEALATYLTACLTVFEESVGDVMGDGNCDGEVTSADSLFDLRFVAQFKPFAACLGTADVDCDFDVDSVDALRKLRRVAGLPNSPPASPDCTPIGEEPEPFPVPTPSPTPTPTLSPAPTGEPTPTSTTHTATPTSTPTGQPTPTPTGHTPTPTPTPTPSPLDSDSDGIPDEGEVFWGSDPQNPQSTPENIVYDQVTAGNTCSDGMDNDLDLATDMADSGCQPQHT